MGMSVWGLIAAPLLTPGAPSADIAMIETPSAAVQSIAGEADIFSGDQVLGIQAMRDAAGGTETAITIGNVGINIADSTSTITDIATNDTTTGDISNITVEANRGATFVTSISGVGVSVQNTYQVNVFLGGAGSQ